MTLLKKVKNLPNHIDKKYFDFISDKSVILVGPSEYLSRLDNGSFIDKFDIVVRVNRGMELIKSVDFVGKRTDILYNCLIESPDNGGKINIPFLKDNNIQWISTVPGSDIIGHCSSNKLHKLVKRKTVGEIKSNFNFHIMNHEAYNLINKEIESRANTGFAAVIDLLMHSPKRLFITGFSFYLDSFIKGYKKGCERSEKQFAQECFNSKRHKQTPQWKLLKKVVAEEVDVVGVDDILSYILNMPFLSRERFNNAFANNIYTN